jgi:tetratricopeptide (TPR) repeat protein
METLSTNPTVQFKAAKCPECGGNLQIPVRKDAVGPETVTCQFCRSTILILRPGASIYAWRKLAEAAAEAGNNYEAYSFYTKILEFDPNNAEAWFGKAEAAGRLISSNGHNRLKELRLGILKATELAPQQELRQRGATVIHEICQHLYGLSAAYVNVVYAWTTHVALAEEIILTLRVANAIDPANANVVALVITICKDLLDGTEYEDIYDNCETKQQTLTPEQTVTIRRLLAAFTKD